MEETTEDLEEDEKPWYLRENVASPLLERKTADIPLVPENAPSEVNTFLELLAKKYGMVDIELFDMTQFDGTDQPFRLANPNVDYIIICSGKSEKHNFKAARELRVYLKKEQIDELPRMEGMASASMTPLMKRRLAKRARKGPPSTANEYGKSANSWILCHQNNIDIHMLTDRRRQELQLELLWCKPEDAHKYEQYDYFEPVSDDIFSGVRRFHTSAVRRSAAGVQTLQRQLNSLYSMDAEAGTEELKQAIELFEKEFDYSDLQSFNIRNEFYRTLHLILPSVVSFEDVEEKMLSKYASLAITLNLNIDLATEKINDVTEFARLLLDTPTRLTKDEDLAPVEDENKELRALLQENHTRLHKLSQFISVLYRFSNDKFSMTQNQQFIPLLYRLTYNETGDSITPLTVDEYIENDTENDLTRDPETSIIFADRRFVDVLKLSEHYMRKYKPGFSYTARFDEYRLFTYGNAGKWARFWKHIEKTTFLRDYEGDAAAKLTFWVRMTVYLSLVNNRKQIVHFLLHHFDHTSSVAGSLVRSYRANEEQFSSELERLAVKRALKAMVARLGNQRFEAIVAFADNL